MKWPDDYLGKIFNCDCIEIMKQLPDKCVDLCLCDPPYGVGENYESFNDTRENLKKLIDSALPEIKRIGKCVAITSGVKSMYLYPEPTWVMNWHTPAGTGCGPWGFCTWQPILLYGKDPYLSAGRGSLPDTIVHTESSEKNGHPCPKPINLWLKIINRVMIHNGIVFDPFMGSGTTAVACERRGFKWFGCELEPKYVAIANKRIEAERNQLKLF